MTFSWILPLSARRAVRWGRRGRSAHARALTRQRRRRREICISRLASYHRALERANQRLRTALAPHVAWLRRTPVVLRSGPCRAVAWPNLAPWSRARRSARPRNVGTPAARTLDQRPITCNGIIYTLSAMRSGLTARCERGAMSAKALLFAVALLMICQVLGHAIAQRSAQMSPWTRDPAAAAPPPPPALVPQ